MPSAVDLASQALGAGTLPQATPATSMAVVYPILHMAGALRAQTAMVLVSVALSFVERQASTHVSIAKGGNGGGSYTGNALGG